MEIIRRKFHRRRVSRALALAVIGTTLSAVESVRADVVVADGFEWGYTLGALNTQSGGYGWNTGSAWQVTTTTAGFVTVVNVNGTSQPTLSYDNGAVHVNGGAKAMQISSPGSTGVIENAFNRQIPSQSGQTVFFSFLLKDLGTLETTAGNSDFAQIALSTSGTTISGSASLNTASTSNDNTMQARMRTAGATPTDTSTVGPSPTTFSAGATYLVVARVIKADANPLTNFSNLAIYLNPTTLTEPGSTTMSISGISIGSSQNYFFGRVARLDSGDQILLDELSVGSTYADVVPEPGGLAAAGIAAGMLL
jgi:hypothetical protein